jgi:DNA-binding CsgD family transcriptional regulator
MLYCQEGATQRTRALLDEAVTLARASGDALAIALATEWLGALAHALGDLDLAEACHAESHAAFCALPPQPWTARNIALIEGRVAWTAFARGDLAAAEAISLTTLEHMRALDDEHRAPYLYEVDALTMLAYVARARGDLAAALAHLQDAIRLGVQVGDQLDVPTSLIRLAATLDELGRQSDAARFLGAAEAICERLGMPLATALTTARIPGNAEASPVRAEIARLVARHEAGSGSRITLADPALASQWAAGRRLSPGGIIADALALDPAQSPPTVAGSATATPAPYDLTPREREVLALLCERLTDPEIAERLFIGRRTVSSHAAHLFAKLGVNTRREAAALAAREGLV